MNILRIIFNPDYWLQNEPYSLAWDTELRRLLETGNHFSNIGEHEATIGGRRVWIGNHPYSSFTFHQVRPSRRMILIAHDQLLRDAGGANENERREKLIEGFLS